MAAAKKKKMLRTESSIFGDVGVFDQVLLEASVASFRNDTLFIQSGQNPFLNQLYTILKDKFPLSPAPAPFTRSDTYVCCRSN